jgi:hypothetical protein
MTKFNDGHFGFVTKLLNSISEELDVEIENRSQVRNFLKFHWGEELESFFETGGTKTAARLIGKKSELLLGQQYAGTSDASEAFEAKYIDA